MEELFSVRRTPLSSPWEGRRDEYDVIVVGSGYGGAITAARLATADYDGAKPSVCLLERGREWLPGQFPFKPGDAFDEVYDAEDNPLGLLQFEGSVDLMSYQGSGLGGTSLLNANVAYEPEPEVFDDSHWPDIIRQERDGGRLDQLFRRVRFTLQTGQHPRGMDLSKVKALAEGAKGHPDAPHFLNRIAVNFKENGNNLWNVAQRKCLNCGDCFSGCNAGAKNTLDTNYLAIAAHGGSQIFPQVTVQHIEPHPDGGWKVAYTRHERGPDGEPREGENGVLRARRAVVVSAGTLGSTSILMRSAQEGLKLSGRLGARFSGNGDFFGLAYNSDQRTDVMGWGAFPLSEMARRVQPDNHEPEGPEDMLTPGPTIVSTVRYNRSGPFKQRVTVQDTSFPLLLVDILRAGLAFSIGKDTDPFDFRDNIREAGRRFDDLNPFEEDREKGALNHSLMYLVMGVDDAEGRIELDSRGNPEIRWDDVGDQEIFKTMNELLESNATGLGAHFVKNPLWGISPWRTLLTVHPLGGCPMGETTDAGVVDDRGRVYNGEGGFHPGLLVTDGSIVPAPVGANPFLTISALSERVAEGLIKDLGGQPRVIQEIRSG